MGSKNIVGAIFQDTLQNFIVSPDNNSAIRPDEPKNPPNPDPKGSSPVISKDVTVNPNYNTWVRIYLPKELAISDATKKLPVIVYYHGGGFVFSNADSVVYDVFCKGLVEKTGGAMVISLDYRLAPEHRLPAAYEDAMEGLLWIKDLKDEWIKDFADLGNVYLAGTSAGGNLAYHAGLRAAEASKDLKPLTIKGLILHHPFFKGTKRTESEKRLSNDAIIPHYANELMLELSLPKGVDHDHEFSNPFINGGSKHINKMKELGWKVLVAGCYDDPLVDACFECANMLENKGLKIVRFFDDGYHAMEAFDNAMSGPLYDAIRDFIFMV